MYPLKSVWLQWPSQGYRVRLFGPFPILQIVMSILSGEGRVLPDDHVTEHDSFVYHGHTHPLDPRVPDALKKNP